MKKTIWMLSFLFLALIGMNNSFAQELKSIEDGARIDFKSEVYDYGTIQQYADGTCYFEFTNTGNAPLVISHAKGSCGCTVPSWPKKPILPGESSKIKVHYDTKRVGVIGKSVTIQSNAVNSPTKTIRIKGNVTPKSGGEAPVNNSGAPVQN